jgi:hypothetical protein
MSVCREVLETALGQPVKPAEADALFAKLQRRATQVKAENPALGHNDALQKAAAEFDAAAELRAALEQRTAALNQARTMEGVDYLAQVWKDDPGQGLKAMLVGTQDARQGARASVGADQDAAEDFVLGGLIADLVKAEGLTPYSRGDLDDEVSRALWQLSDGETPTGPKVAVQVAKAIRKWQDYAKRSANEAGAWIGSARGFITSTFHDSARIAPDEAGWLASAKEHFDLGRMAEEMEVSITELVDDILPDLWRNFASGVHLKATQPSSPPKGLQSVGKKLSHERVIHFKSPEAWQAYNRDYGAGTLHEAVAAGLRRQARSTALMAGLGPNYEMVFDNIVEQTTRRMQKGKASAAALKQFQKDARTYKRMYLAQVDGSLDIPGSDPLATASAAIRSVQSMASLGGATLSSLSDLGLIANGAKYNGVNALEAIGSGIGKLFQGMPSGEKLELYADLGLVLSSLSGKLTSRFTPEDSVTGRMGKLQHTFFTLNLQNRWTDAFRESVAEVLSANLARRSRDSFDALPERLRTTLGLYGIEADKWDIFRAQEAGEVDGVRFLAPKGLDEVPDDRFAAYLTKRGINATSNRIRELRSEMARQFRAYFADQNGYMVLTPDAGTLGMMKQGTQKGTGVGEAVRFIMQFKSFPLAYTQKAFGRELKQGGLLGIANLLALTTVFGYAAMTAKDMSKGHVPRNPTDPRSWLAAFQQGGGAGLYGDVLFSQILDRRFGDAAAQLMGPTFSDVFGSQGLAGLTARGMQAARSDNVDVQDVGPAAVRFVKGNTPFLNLFYTRLLLDYAVFYRLQEWMNPGSLARMERELQERTGQEFVAPPSQQ